MRNNPIKRAAVYIRVSTADQVENFSLGAQEETCKGIIKQKGLNFYKTYREEGESGANTQRPRLIELRADMEKGLFDTVIVYKSDRLSRSLIDLLTLIKAFADHNVAFISATEPFDTSTPTGRLMMSQFGAFAEFERNTFMERSRLGRHRRVEQGFYPDSACPTGYRQNKATKKLELDPVASVMIKRGFELYAKPDMSFKKVADILRAEGYKTIKGVQIQTYFLDSIFSNTVYIGKWLQFRYDRRGAITKPEAQWRTIDVPPIVDKALFELVQERKQERRHAGRVEDWADYLLSSLRVLKCGNCGTFLTGFNYKNIYKNHDSGDVIKKYPERQFYSCPGRGLEVRPTGCKIRKIPAAPINDAVWSLVKKVVLNPEMVKKAIEQPVIPSAHAIHPKDAIEQLDTERDRLIDLCAKGIIQESDLKKRLDENEKQRQSMCALEAPPKTEEIIQDYQTMLKSLNEKIDHADFETKREIIRLLVSEIIVDPDGHVTVTMPVFVRQYISEQAIAEMRLSVDVPLVRPYKPITAEKGYLPIHMNAEHIQRMHALSDDAGLPESQVFATQAAGFLDKYCQRERLPTEFYVSQHLTPRKVKMTSYWLDKQLANRIRDFGSRFGLKQSVICRLIIEWE